MLQVPVQQRVMIYLPATKPNISQEEMEHLIQVTIEKRGLNKPFPVQYVNWLRNLVRGEWGYSPVWRQPVLAGILQRVPASAELALVAMIPAIVLALVLGSLAAQRYHRSADYIIRVAAFVGWAFPPLF